MKSNTLLARESSQLLIIDFQEKLARVMEGGKSVEDKLIRLVEVSEILGVPSIVTEQYPKGLGPTTEPLAAALRRHNRFQPIEKTMFSCCGVPAFDAKLRESGDFRGQLVVTGIETHVCVLQTVIGCLATEYQVFVVADAVTSRSRQDYQAALDRMARLGATIVTFEMVIFEWLRRAGTSEFKLVQRFITG
jgi:nicotinamidase-related amidase